MFNMSKPKVALVFTTFIMKNAFHGMLLPALGLERLGAEIEDIADVELFDIRFEPDMMMKLKQLNPDFVAVNVKTTMYANHSYEVGKEIRCLLPKTVIVTGGLHATALPDESFGFADYVIRGEGEKAFRQLIEGHEPSTIPNLVYKENGKTIVNPMAVPEKNLDGLKPPARHLRKPYYDYSASGIIKMDILETSRGCTHACSFCSGGSVYPNNYRVHSPKYVMEEIRRIAATGVKWCMLSDDHFGDFKRAEEISDLIIKSGIKMVFFSFIRPFEGRMALKKKMVAAGFVMLSYGAESPNPAQRKRYGKGHPKSEDFIKNVNREWLEAGASYVGNSYVFGDVEDDAETLATFGTFARGLNPTYIEPLYSQPYPGTVYREELKKKNLLLENGSWDRFTEGRLLVKHPDVNEDQLKRLRANIWLDFFSPRKFIMQSLTHLLMLTRLGIPRARILKHLALSKYTLFGCYLEDKYYKDLYPGMVDTYFRQTIRTFEPEEMDMSITRLDALSDMFCLKPVKSLLGNCDFIVKIDDKGNTLVNMVFEVRNARIDSGYAVLDLPDEARPKIKITLPLDLIKKGLTSDHPIMNAVVFLGVIGKNMFPVLMGVLRVLTVKNKR